MSSLFRNHSAVSQVAKHKTLPIYQTSEFNFYRCVNINENWVYRNTISNLHAGNLRQNKIGRYSKLFPDEKISYWADSKETALAEIRKHNGNKDYLTFWAYDDASSTFPILGNLKELIIIDGKELEFREILQKIEDEKELTKKECATLNSIKQESPDCLAYRSFADSKGTNYLFFEKGFKKLALREVTLYLGERRARNKNKVICAYSSDYTPFLEGYGQYFEPLAKVKMNEEYKKTDEYRIRLNNINNR